MYASIVGVVRFKDILAADLSLKTNVGLIAFRNSQGRIKTAREVCVERAELFDERRGSR